MGDIFLKLLNMSISAGWLILVVLCVRFLFRKMPKWVNCVLWGVVAVRLLVPFSVESAFSLQPSAEPIKTSAIVEGEVLPYIPSIDSNLSIVENTVNPMLAETFFYHASESAAPPAGVYRDCRRCMAVRNDCIIAFCHGKYGAAVIFGQGGCSLQGFRVYL